MRIKNNDDISRLGVGARKQIEAILNDQGGFNNQKRAGNVVLLKKNDHANAPPSLPVNGSTKQKQKKPSRVMRTADNLTYCPWPSTDPFVAVHQMLEKKYGRYEDGGKLLTEMIIEGGAQNWRFDLVLISPFVPIDIFERETGRKKTAFMGNITIVEADGFGFHRSKEAFKNDRTKQTHAIKQGFSVQRITNEDARHRLDDILHDIDTIMSQDRIYPCLYAVKPKGKTQSVFRWLK